MAPAVGSASAASPHLVQNPIELRPVFFDGCNPNPRNRQQFRGTPRLIPREGGKFPRKVQDLQVLSRPATRRTEVFIRADRSEDWYHQGLILPGKMKLTCHFGGEKTEPGTGFHISAITTDEVIPDQQGRPTKPFPKSRTESAKVHVIRI